MGNDEVLKESPSADFLIRNGVLLSINAVGDVVIPEGVTKISRGTLLRAEGMGTLTLPSSLKQIERGNFVEARMPALKEIYYPGPLATFQTFRFNYAERFENPPTVFLKNAKGEYGPIIWRSTLYYRAKGFEPGYLDYDWYSFRNDAGEYFQRKAKEHEGEMDVLVGYEQGVMRLMFDFPAEGVTPEIREALRKKGIAFGCRDYCIRSYWPEGKGLSDASFLGHDELVIKDGTLLQAKPKRKPGNEYAVKRLVGIIPNEVHAIDENAFAQYDCVRLALHRDFEEAHSMFLGLHLRYKDYGAVSVAFNDCLVSFYRIQPPKANARLYYSGTHMRQAFNLYAIHEADKGRYFGYLRNVFGAFDKESYPLNISGSTYFEDSEDEGEPVYYHLLDYDNFFRVDCVDFEAG